MRYLIATAVLTLSGSAIAETWTVDDDGAADFDNIQAAVDAASDGDEILVEPGAYTSSQAEYVVNMLGKEISLRSNQGPDVTIIDGEGARQGIRCTSGETELSIISGFTITNGNGFWGGGLSILNSRPTITNCTLTNNTNFDIGPGGGVCIMNSAPKFTNCNFTHNSNYGMFCGIFSNVTLTNCMLKYNNGTGIELQNKSTITLTNTTICGNSQEQINGDWSDGGGNIIAEICLGDPGACCTGNDLACVIATEEDCEHFGHTWLGKGTACDDSPCPTACLGDVTGDGEVSVNDVLTVIANWGPCP